jgi:hypothetical protein
LTHFEDKRREILERLDRIDRIDRMDRVERRLDSRRRAPWAATVVGKVSPQPDLVHHLIPVVCQGRDSHCRT